MHTRVYTYRRDIAAARQLLEEAREAFEQAGPGVARDREMILGNLRSSVSVCVRVCIHDV
jgi:hypothetical protein